MRLRLGLVTETSEEFLNQVELCLFSWRMNAGALREVPVTLITNGEPLEPRPRSHFEESYGPIEFATSPRLGAIRHTSKLNVFYSVDPSTYDVLIFVDCDTVVRRPLDRMIDGIDPEREQFVCRRGGETDRNRFVDFDALVRRFCGREPGSKVVFEGSEEWPMFNTGVFLGTSRAIRKIRGAAVDTTYRLFNEWQRVDALARLPPDVKALLESEHPTKYRTRRHILADWPIEQGALALACIRAGVDVRYLDGTFNSWGGEDDFHVLHCFKSLYKFDRRTMFASESADWIEEYLASEIPGKRFLGGIVREVIRSLRHRGGRAARSEEGAEQAGGEGSGPPRPVRGGPNPTEGSAGRAWVRPEVGVRERSEQPSPRAARTPDRGKALAIVLSWKRPENLPRVIGGLRRQSYVGDILCIHNFPSDRRIEGCLHVVSDLNFGCAIRHQVAALLDYDTFVFSDDDLMLTEDLAPRLLPVLEAHGRHSVIGLYGQMLDRSHPRAAYSHGKPVTAREPMPVDVVKGRFHVLTRETLQALSGPGLSTPTLLAEDDLRVNIAVQLVFDEPGYLVPAIGVKELPAPHARWHRNNHLADRDRAVFEGFQLGWKPLGPLDDPAPAE